MIINQKEDVLDRDSLRGKIFIVTSGVHFRIQQELSMRYSSGGRFYRQLDYLHSECSGVGLETFISHQFADRS